jgi:hypothetical protein
MQNGCFEAIYHLKRASASQQKQNDYKRPPSPRGMWPDGWELSVERFVNSKKEILQRAHRIGHDRCVHGRMATSLLVEVATRRCFADFSEQIRLIKDEPGTLEHDCHAAETLYGSGKCYSFGWRIGGTAIHPICERSSFNQCAAFLQLANAVADFFAKLSSFGLARDDEPSNDGDGRSDRERKARDLVDGGLVQLR